MLRSGERVAVAVSGGPDSVALLHALRELSSDLGVSLAVAHLNHRLRGEDSGRDQEFVRDLASSLALQFFVHSIDVRAEADKQNENLEQTARLCRYQWFHRLITDGLADKVAVGHTRSDQAETVLYRLLRGSGSAGLAGIRPVLDGKIVRPLLEVSRPQVIEYLKQAGHEWREDPSNADDRFDRNRLRHQLMPQLSQEWNPRIEESLARTAEWARAEEAYWAELLPTLASKMFQRESGSVGLSAAQVSKLPVAVQRRLLRAALAELRGDLRAIDFEHVEELRRLLAEDRRTGSVHLPGVEATRSFDRFRLVRADARESEGGTFNVQLEAPGSISIPGTSSVLVLKLLDRADVKDGYNSKQRHTLDWSKVPRPLRLRNWRAGDRYRPSGRSKPKRLKVLFQEHQVEAWRRAGWPVVTGCREWEGRSGDLRHPGSHGGEADECIVWTRRFGPAEEFAADEGSETLLEIVERDRSANFLKSNPNREASNT